MKAKLIKKDTARQPAQQPASQPDNLKPATVRLKADVAAFVQRQQSLNPRAAFAALFSSAN